MENIVAKTLEGRTLILVFEVGTKENGDPKLWRKSFTGINADCTDEELHGLGEQLAGLIPKPLLSIYLDEDYLLKEETPEA